MRFFMALIVSLVLTPTLIYAQESPPLPGSVNPYPQSTGLIQSYVPSSIDISQPQMIKPTSPMTGIPRHYGVIASTSQWHIQFTDARSVDLHPYTIIEPRGATLRKGQRILVLGYYQYTTKVNAPVIDARSIVIVNGDGKDR